MVRDSRLEELEEIVKSFEHFEKDSSVRELVEEILLSRKSQLELKFPIKEEPKICSYCLNGDHSYHDSSCYKLGCQSGETIKPCRCNKEKE